MADGRRTRWVAHDVYFLDEGLGHAMFDRFGGVGIALWHGFIAACKKNHIEGQTSWSSDVEALQVLGLPGMSLVDNDGEPFGLDEWLKLLSDHKVIRRTSRGRRVKVACTKWARWQHDARRAREAGRKARERREADEQSRRSEQENTPPPPGQPPDESLPDTDTDTDTDTTTSSAVADPKVPQAVRDLANQFATAVKANGFKVPKPDQPSRRDWLTEMDRLVRLGAPGGDPDPQDPTEVAKVIEFATNDSFWKANIGSPSKFREQYPKLRLRMQESSNGHHPKQDPVTAEMGAGWR